MNQDFESLKEKKTMKNRLLLLLVIVAMVGIAVALNYSKVGAQQEGATKDVYPVEFTTLKDVDQAGARDAQQVLYTQPDDAAGAPFPRNTFDFHLPDPDTTYPDVDALANWGDAYFHEVATNQADLLISFQGDPNRNAVYYETPGGARGVKWTQLQLDRDTVTIKPWRELDALEVWGPIEADDANCWSEMGDPGNVCVWIMNHGAYITHATIVTAVVALGCSLSTQDSLNLDLDGLMVWVGNFDGMWNAGDTVIFSVRATGRPPKNWDGGEIVVLPFNGAPTFLNHGGHLWNTAFNVQAAFGVNTEEVDAIEAFFATGPVPVTINPESHTFVPCPIRVAPPGIIRFYNASPSITIVVKIWNKVTHATTSITIPPLGYQDHTVETGECEIKVFNSATGDEIFECTTEQCQTPTLTQWGLIILVALIVFSTWVVLRRRRAVVSRQ
jgi:hypothetical protein